MSDSKGGLCSHNLQREANLWCLNIELARLALATRQHGAHATAAYPWLAVWACP